MKDKFTQLIVDIDNNIAVDSSLTTVNVRDSTVIYYFRNLTGLYIFMIEGSFVCPQQAYLHYDRFILLSKFTGDPC